MEIAIGIVLLLVLCALFCIASAIGQGATLKMDRQQLVGMMAACIMGQQGTSGAQVDYCSEFGVSGQNSASQAVVQASQILQIIDNTWGPSPAVATEERARQIIDQIVRQQLPVAIEQHEYLKREAKIRQEMEDEQERRLDIEDQENEGK